MRIRSLVDDLRGREQTFLFSIVCTEMRHQSETCVFYLLKSIITDSFSECCRLVSNGPRKIEKTDLHVGTYERMVGPYKNDIIDVKHCIML